MGLLSRFLCTSRTRTSVLQASPESEGVHSSLLSYCCVEGEGVHEAGGGEGGKGKEWEKRGEVGRGGEKKGKEWKMRGKVELNLVKQVGQTNFSLALPSHLPTPPPHLSLLEKPLSAATLSSLLSVMLTAFTVALPRGLSRMELTRTLAKDSKARMSVNEQFTIRHDLNYSNVNCHSF